MRNNVTERYYRFFTGQQVDRIPDVEFGWWPQTVRRWLGEGLPRNLTDEWFNAKFAAADEMDTISPKLEEYFGLDTCGVTLSVRTHLNPCFPERVLEKRGHALFMVDARGTLLERYPNEADESSIPRFVKFPVENPADWVSYRERYRLDDPTRFIPESDIEMVRSAAGQGRMINVSLLGFYGQLRNWMGIENLSLALYDQPGLIEEMVGHWSELCARQIERLPVDVPVDQVGWWEDMASKNGPLVSPAQFRQFFTPGYRRVMEAARRRGCAFSLVDCDGNPAELVPCWLEVGVNVMLPLEVQAGADPHEWRRRYGSALLLRGGLDKEAVARGPRAIQEELRRVRPLIEQGGYIPHLDHLVPPTVPYVNYLEYLRQKRAFIGRTA
ncbi:MAG: uroporphyrinogen decarboxylase family protein [Spirochaetia bacterium]|jgi:uroporphyrinogen decarboxylase